PSRSHFQSMATWHSARLDPEDHGEGWLGRALDSSREDHNAGLHIGDGPPPVALRGRRAVASSLERIDDFLLDSAAESSRAIAVESGVDAHGEDLTAFVHRSALDAYATADRIATLVRDRGDDARYPKTRLAERLHTVARLIKGKYTARVYYTVQEG